MKIWGIVLSSFMIASCTESSLTEPFRVQSKDQGVIYVWDSRIESSQIRSVKYQKEKQSSLAMIYQRKLQKVTDETYLIRSYDLINQYNFCPDERYARQMSAAACSTTLVAEDLIMTAGHCFPSDLTCSDIAFVKGFVAQDDLAVENLFSSDQIYQCSQIEYLSFGDFESQLDVAFIRLDRKVKGVQPIDLNRSRDVVPGERLFSFSYPSGLPQKFLMGKVRSESSESPIFRAAIDAFHGSSGAMVYSQTDHAPLGIILGGEEDYVFDSKKLCFRPQICAKGECRGEKILKINSILKTLSQYGEMQLLLLDIKSKK